MKAAAKRILIISDNSNLVKFFKEECTRQRIEEIAELRFCYSAGNKNPAEMITLGAEPVDVKSFDFIRFAKESYDLIFSLHCKQIFPVDLVESIVCINIHPGFNPYNRGWYPQVFSLINKKPIGATIHIMDSDVDHGDVVDQVSVNVKSSDTSLDVYLMVIEAEKKLIENNLLKMISGNYSVSKVLTDGNYNSIGDFKSLCALDLDSVASLKNHIDLLRALSHGKFKNAFFLDDQGKKVFVRVTLDQASE